MSNPKEPPDWFIITLLIFACLFPAFAIQFVAWGTAATVEARQ